MKKYRNGFLVDMTADEIFQREQQEKLHASELGNRLALDIRNQRNRLLQDTDWMALSDNTMTPEWASYRQALRDITDQTGFPYSVVWPTKPE
jgi:hypothetical protein